MHKINTNTCSLNEIIINAWQNFPEQSDQALFINNIWWLMLNFEIDVMWLITGIDLIHIIESV